MPFQGPLSTVAFTFYSPVVAHVNCGLMHVQDLRRAQAEVRWLQGGKDSQMPVSRHMQRLRRGIDQD